MSQAVLRMWDANYNRAKEALRVVEDVARFYLADGRLTSRLKRARHDLTKTALGCGIAYRKLVEARDSREDVGARGLIRDKRSPQWRDLFLSNLKRSQEAARVLEELSKMVKPEKTRTFQALRFRLYELEKEGIRKF